MPNVTVAVSGNNAENVQAFWINVSGMQGGGARWGLNGEPWDAVVAIPSGQYTAGMSVANIQNIPPFQIDLPQQNAEIVYEVEPNEIIIGILGNEVNSTVNIDVNN